MRSPASLPPSPALSSLGQAVRFGADPHGFLLEQSRAIGPVWTLRMPRAMPMVFVGDPELVRAIFGLAADAVHADRLEVTLDLGRHSLLFLDGSEHKAERKLLMPALHGDHLRALGGLMQRTVREQVSRWPKGRPFSLSRALHDVTRAVITKTVFGVDEPRRAKALENALVAWLDAAMASPVLAFGLLWGAARVRKLLAAQTAAALARGPRAWRRPWALLGERKARVVRLLRDEVARARRAPRRSDVLAMLLEATYDDGRPITDDHVIDELLTLLVGGHETTSSTVCWTLREVLARPELQRRGQEEIAAAGDVDPTDTKALPYVDALACEAMRLFPIAPGVPRVLAREVEVGGRRFPPGIQLTPCSLVVHRSPALWEDPEAFEPERFLGRSYPAHHYFPFGGGKRRCIGMAFATFEMRILLAEILPLELELVHAAPHGSMRGLTVEPGRIDVIRP